MKRLLFILTLAIVLSSCCACNIKYRRDVKPLAQTKWSLIQKDGMAVDAKENFFILITDQGKLSGKGDCNQIMAECDYSDKGGNIKISSVSLSRAMCANNKAEAEFVEMLTKADTYSIDIRLLMLFSEGKLLGVFESKP